MTILLMVSIGFLFFTLAWLADQRWVELHAHAYRCVRDEHEIKAGRAIRVIFALLGVATFGLTPKVSRWAARFASAGMLARNGAAVVAAILVAEVILRKPLTKVPAPPPAPPLCPALTFDPEGFHLTPHHACIEAANGRDVPYFIDVNGNRAASIDHVDDPTVPTIVVIGESVALGVGVPYDETFSAKLANDLSIQVVDTGVYGYSLGQAYQRERHEMAHLSRPIAVVAIFVSEEAERTEKEDLPRERSNRAGTLDLVPPTPEWERNLELRKLWRSLYHGDAEMEDMRAAAGAIANDARNHGAYPLFVTTNFVRPCLVVGGQTPALFRRIFDEQGLSSVHVELAEGQMVPANGHPNAQGHARIAEAIETSLRDAGVLPSHPE